MRILIVTPKHAEANPLYPLDATYGHLIKPTKNLFKNNPDVEIITEFIEPTNIWSSETLDNRLSQNNFDICIFSPYREIFPSISLAKKIGKKLFICCWDSHCGMTSNRLVNLRLFLKNKYDNGIVKSNHSMLEYSNFCNILIFDNCYGQIFPNIYSTFIPMDTEELYPISDNEKKYDLAFIGTIYESERHWYLSRLLSSNLPFKIFGGKSQNQKGLDYSEWAKINRETKMSINFNGNSFRGARKARAWEIAACKNLMITTMPEVYDYSKGKLFIDGKHFVSIDAFNYLSKIEYFLKNDEERIKIASNMHEYWKENYSAEIWWNNVINWSKIRY